MTTTSDARKRRREANPAPTADLCATAEQVAARCIKLHIHNSADPDRETSTYRQAAEMIGGLVDALRVREARATPAEPDADEREWNIDYALVARIIASDPSPAEALRAFVAQEIEAATSRTPDAHLAAGVAYIESLTKREQAAMDLWWRASGDDWAVPDDLPGKFLREVLRAARLREQGGE